MDWIDPKRLKPLAGWGVHKSVANRAQAAKSALGGDQRACLLGFLRSNLN